MSSRADALEVPAPPPTVFRRAAGVLVGAVVWLWLKTLRLTVEAHPALDGVAGRPWVLSFWHGAQMPLRHVKVTPGGAIGQSAVVVHVGTQR